MVPTSLPFLVWGRLSRSPSWCQLLSRFFFGGVCLGPPVPTSLPFLVWGRLSRSPSGANFSPVSFLGAFV